MLLSNLGACRIRRYAVTKAMKDLTEATEVAKEATEVAPNDHPDLALFLNNLGKCLKAHFMLTARVEDLSRTIEVRERVVKVTPDGDPNLIQYLHNLAVDLQHRHGITRSLVDLARAIEMDQRAIEVARDNYPEVHELLNTFGNSLGARYDETGLINDLGSAIDVFEKIVTTVPQGHPSLSWYLIHFGVWLRARFEATGSMEDLERAIEMNKRAVESTPETKRETLAVSLSHLGVCLGIRSEQRRSADDLNEAIQLSERAVATIPDNHPDLAAVCSNLGKWLVRRSDRASLTRAIQVTQKAIEKIGDDHLHSGTCLSTLSQALRKRFEMTGSVSDLTRAMEAAQKAVQATPNDHPNFATHSSALASSLNARHNLAGSGDDLARALEVAEKAVEATPHDHTTYAGKLLNLSIHLGKQFNRTGALNDLTRAIEVSQQAVERSDFGSLAPCLQNLGSKLHRRYRETMSIEDLEHAIEAAQRAIEAAEDEFQFAMSLINFGPIIADRYARTGSMDDLTKAIEGTEKGVEMIGQDVILLSGYLTNLGNMLGFRYAQTGAKTDQDAQLSAYVRAWHCTTSPPSDRIRPATLAADMYASRAEWHKAYSLFREAVLLLPKVSQRSLKQSDMQAMLSPTSGLATDAAAVALVAGEPSSEVLSILELGRGVIAGLLIDSRGDLSDLRVTHPSLANRFDALRSELDSPSQSRDSLGELSMCELSMVNRRHEASREFDEIIEQIRAQEGFNGFLEPPPTESLMAAAESGPVVVINVSVYRCDAILVERHTLRRLGLPDLTLEEVENYVRDIRNSRHSPWRLLEWLWTTICKPCLDALGFTRPAGDGQWPHVWWVPTGPLSHLPLHAAGIYATLDSNETVLDRVVSSYASSIKGLQHARRRRVGMLGEHAEQNDAILIAMEETKGQASLPYAGKEIDKIRALCPLLQLNAMTPPLRKADILEHLRKCRILHFAGHGASKRDPSQSCLVLDDWETNPLTVGDLRESWLQESPAFLAYLSACSTGSNQGKGLADEAIHLVSAFQLAGFRHVVGTLWEVSDPHCVDVATVLYQTLCDEGMTDEAVSHGLHRAIRKLRDESFREGGKRDIVQVGEDEGGTPVPGVNTFWIPYVHFGA